MDWNIKEALDPFEPFHSDPEIRRKSIRAYLMRCLLADGAYWERHAPEWMQKNKKITDEERSIAGQTEVRKKLLAIGAERVEFVRGKTKVGNDKVSSQAILVWFEDKVFVIPAGTNEPKDWMTNLDSKKVKIENGGMVHDGFQDYILSLEAVILSFLKPGDKLIFIGHSLGAAGAARGARRFKSAGWAIIMLTTFGEPMNGDDLEAKLTSKALGDIYDRFDFCCDIVTEIPPESLGFEHSVEPWDISSSGEFLKGDGAAQLSRVWGRINGALHLRWLTGWGGDHFSGIAHHLLRTSYLPIVAKKYKIKLPWELPV